MINIHKRRMGFIRKRIYGIYPVGKGGGGEDFMNRICYGPPTHLYIIKILLLPIERNMKLIGVCEFQAWHEDSAPN